MFLRNEDQINKVIAVLDKFKSISGLSLNKNKTEAIWIGSNSLRRDTFGNLKWNVYPNNNVKTLGITFSSTTSASNINENWGKKVNSIKLIIEAWKYRQLSMVGKILIVKCLMASQLTYVSSVIVLPEHVITQLNSIFHKFVWRKGERVKRKTLMLNYDQGGLRMVDLKSFLYSLQMSWVKKC